MHMKYKLALAFLLSLFFANTGAAETLKGGYYACLSKDYLNEISTAKGDHLAYLKKVGCIAPRAGTSVHDLGGDGFAVHKIRVVIDGLPPVIMWTPFENIIRD